MSWKLNNLKNKTASSYQPCSATTPQISDMIHQAEIHLVYVRFEAAVLKENIDATEYHTHAVLVLGFNAQDVLNYQQQQAQCGRNVNKER